MAGYFHRVGSYTPTRFWINNVTRREAGLALDAGAVGCTQNPAYVWKMLSSEEEGPYAESRLRAILPGAPDDEEALRLLQRDLVSGVAARFRPLYEASGGELGYVSIQGEPFDESFETILALARLNREAGPNVMAKIPVTEDGLRAVGQCVREGMPVNATEVMSLRQAMELCDVYEEASRGMGNPPKVYLSHIAGIFDEYLAGAAAAQGLDVPRDFLYVAGKAVARKIRAYMDARGTKVGFINGGARGLQHFTEWVGGDVCSTINWKGCAEDLIREDPPVVSRFDCPVPELVIDTLLDKLPDFRKAWEPKGLEPSDYERYGPVQLFCSGFRKAWLSARERIAELRAQGLS